MRRILHAIGGEPTAPASGAYLPVLEPATGRVAAEVAAGDARDVDRAVTAARAAYPAWSSLPVRERARHLLALADAVEQRLEAFARAESIDTGKPIDLALRVDIPRAVLNLRFFATAVQHARSEFYDGQGMSYVLRRPRGVAGTISPWNLPLYLLTWKIAPALATGNTVVAKPSELTPVTASMLAELTREIGWPAGVLNVVHGRGDAAGAALVAHPDVPAISFTGGTRTGAAIAREAAPRFKRLSLELGGKNPTIVFADAPLDETVRESVRAAFSNQGQICLCGSRLLVERSILAPFTERFVAAARELTPGDPLEPGTRLGSLVSAEHREKVARFVALAREEGGRILCGGGPPAALPERCRGGFFFEPTVIDGLGPECRVNREEIFGPVATILPFESEREAVELAGATPYGLAASIWTRDLDRAHRVAAAIPAGTVWINCWMLRDLRTPFGGMRASGVGREGGEEALRFFTEPKTVCLRVRPEAEG